MNIHTISPHELTQRVSDGRPIDLIDVRTPAEFQELHVEFASNVPLHQLDPSGIASQRHSQQEPLYVICRTGSRGEQACQRLHEAGLTNVVNIGGGTEACEQAGWPLVRGKRVMSLERQVRIAAGSIVLVGAVLAALVHPGFAWLAAFVGAGLVFAGITDTCGMGMLLARMPWNQAASSRTESAAAAPDSRGGPACDIGRSRSCCG